MTMAEHLFLAGATLDNIIVTPDGVWGATRPDGDRLSFGRNRDDGWDYAIYNQHNDIVAQDWWPTDTRMAEHVADFLTR